MRKRFVIVAGIAVSAILALSGSSCGNDSGTPQQTESQAQQSNYERLTAEQPATMPDSPWSPTRAGVNFWTATWMTEPGKLSYVYLLASNGQMIGYFIFEGLPISYCASLTPTYRWEDIPNDGSDAHAQVPAPSVDGVYYSGGQCNAFYGKDAVSGSYMEYTTGTGISALVYEQPLPRQDVEPLGIATVDTVGE